MMVPAWIPPLWFRVMDQRVSAHYGGDMSRIHMQPGVRTRLGVGSGNRG